MRISPIQESFASGEIDPRIHGRVSSDAYKSGLKRARNWRPLVQGGITLREGSKYIEIVDNQNWMSGIPGAEGIRAFTFQRGVDEDVILEIGDTNIIARNSVTGEQLVGGVSDNLLPDPTFINGFPSTQWIVNTFFDTFNTTPALIGTGFAGPFFQGLENAYIKVLGQGHRVSAAEPNGFRATGLQSGFSSPVTIPAGSELLLNELTLSYLLIFSDDQIAALGAFPLDDPVIKVRIGTTPGGFDVLDNNISIAANTTQAETTLSFIPGIGNNSLFLSVGLFWTGTTDPVPDLRFDVNNDVAVFSLDLGPMSWVAPLAGGSGSNVQFVSPWTAEQLECLQFCMDPGEQVAFFTHPEVETHRLRLSNGEWTFEALSSIALPDPFQGPTPNNWAAGNFPVSCAFHEGRLYLGGSPSDPATLWASRSGDYVDFDNAAPAAKDDPLLFPLSSSGSIQTLTSRKELVINTDISEVIGTSVQGVISFDDFSFPKQTDWGSNCVQPIVVGRDMVFTSNSRRRMRTFSDEGGTNYGWDGQDLTLLARDIFNSPVRRMVYLDEPAYQACFLLADGTLGMATFFYPEKVIGWWRYTTAYNGNSTYGDQSDPGLGNQVPNLNQAVNQVMDITKINTSQGAQLWMIINRVGFPGTIRPGHELVQFDIDLIPRLDSWSRRSVDPITFQCSDVDELTDQSVSVVVEVQNPFTNEIQYTVHPNVTVIAGVTSPLQSWAAGQIAYLGLFYENDFQLLSREGASNRGTSQVSKRRWNKVYARLNKSAIPLIEGIYAKDRTPSSSMGQGEPIITGDTTMVDLGSGEADITILQDRPLQTEVTALFGKLTSTEV